ncbi:hypothetical protein VFC49_06965 [Thermococcus sp. SY098]|uniref:hypothetical protein n=1 Tax=Thermococcus sp. SY098 TaxID=3111325 RepID=UPI002D79600B|nr:hypothetical protein [Thermococcus sp. SY098]WRS51826.1 hypothetical protein VFC49_06965 [Thermococcus sp. SY098]
MLKFNLFGKRKRSGGIPKKRNIVEEKIVPKAEERVETLSFEETPLDEYKPAKQSYEDIFKQLNFKKTQHEVLKIMFKRPETKRREIITLGYIQGIAMAPNGFYAIAYLPKAPSWLDEVFLSITRTVARYKHLKVLWAFEQFVTIPALDYTVIVEASEIRETEYGQFAFPPAETEEEKALFEAIYMKANALEETLRTLLEDELHRLIDAALNINPYLKSYNVLEKKKDPRKKLSLIKYAEGEEITFNQPPQKEKGIWEEFNL